MRKWFDVHTHLQMLEGGPDAGYERAKAAGVEKMITIGTCPEDWPTVLDLSGRFAKDVFCTLGCHPHEAALLDDAAEKFLNANLPNERVVAVGEIGLDYYYNNAPREQQIEMFERQMEIAATHKLPVEIHTRDAEEDTAEVLKKYRGRVRGLLHCFTSSWNLAKAALDVDFHISISGVVTFKNAVDLRDTVTKIPLNRLHVETDAPFLAPIPHRGKKNEPAWVVHTAECVAGLKNIPLDELSEATRSNALDLFWRMTLN
jgi:TatD DNase family protein